MAIRTPTYQRSVGLKPLNNAQVQYNNSGTMAAANGTQAMGNMAKSFDAWAQVREKQIDEDITDSVVAAQTEYKQQIRNVLYDPENGLMNRKGEYAKNINEEFLKNEEDIRKKVMGGLPMFEKAQQTFNNLANDYTNNSMGSIVEYQGKQRSEYRKLTFNNATDAAVKEMNYNDINSIKRGMVEIERLGNIYARNDYGEEGYKAYITGQRENIATTFANQAYQAKDWDGLDRVLKEEGKHMDPNNLAKFNGILREERDKDDIYKTFEGMKGNFLKSDGTFDSEAAEKYINDNYGPNAVKTVTKKIGGVKTLDDFLNLVGTQESGGDYTAQNGRTGAFGKYQIMPENWLSWSKEAGLPEGAEQTPENQEKVVRYKMGNYFNKYGAEGALVAWYAGERNAQRWVEGKQTALGENGEYSWDAKQGYGNEPSVSEYVQQTLSRSKEQEVTETISNFNSDKYEKLKQMSKAFGAETRQNLAIRNADELDRVKNGLVELKGTPTAQFKLIDDSSLPLYIKNELRNKLDEDLKPKARQESDFGAKAMLLKLKAAGQLTEQDVLNQTRFLTTNDSLSFLTAAYDIGAKRNDKSSNIADKKWQAYLENDGPYSKDSKKNKQLVVEISDMLDNGGTVGEERYQAALERIKQEKDNSGSILNWTSNNNAEKQQLYQAFDPKLVNLIEQGLKRSGEWTGNYHDVNVMASYIGKQIQDGDDVAQHAIDMILEDNVGLNMATWNEYYDAAQKDLY